MTFPTVAGPKRTRLVSLLMQYLEDDRRLILHPAEQPITVTYGEMQVQTSLEPTTFHPQVRTLISIHLLLAAELQHCPALTLQKL